MSKLYHRELGLPKQTEFLFGKTYKLRYSNHAKQACLNDRYGMITPPFTAEITRENLIEVELNGQAIVKAVIRIPYNDKNDLVIVLMPDFDMAFVKTVWLNDRADNHKTLKTHLYSRV